MGIFDYWKKEKPKPDFSNVRSGGSSTAPAPAPRTPRGRRLAPRVPWTEHVRRGQG